MNESNYTQDELAQMSEAEKALTAIEESDSGFFSHIDFEEQYAHISIDDHEITFECDDVDLYPAEDEIAEIAARVGIEEDMFSVLELYNRQTPTVSEPIESGGMVRLPERTFNPELAGWLIDSHGIEVADMGEEWFTVRTFYPGGHIAEIGYGHYPDDGGEQ